MDIPEYDKEQWWQECLKEKPDLQRPEFEMKWATLWQIAQFMGLIRRKT